MKKLTYYSDDSFEFHTSVIKNKKNPDDKNFLENLEDKIKPRFETYDLLFTANLLESITDTVHSEEESKKLRELYRYKSKIIQGLKTKLTTSDTNRIINTCPNCTISEISTFDHYLPKEKFPEFSVNPKNLFPCCQICNGHKSTNWRYENKRLFLNLYLDPLSHSQYLFVNLLFDNDVVTPKFYISNINKIDPDLFEIIESHYNRLKLCSRFELSANETISNLDSTIQVHAKNGFSVDIIKNIVLDKSEENKQVFGFNYWKMILETTLINNEEYMRKFNDRNV